MGRGFWLRVGGGLRGLRGFEVFGWMSRCMNEWVLSMLPVIARWGFVLSGLPNVTI